MTVTMAASKVPPPPDHPIVLKADRMLDIDARRIVEQAIGERLDGKPLPDPDACKNPHAVALGRMGGKKGGDARAKKLSSSKKKAIARKAANTRWLKHKGQINKE